MNRNVAPAVIASCLISGAALSQVSTIWPTPLKTVNFEGKFWDPGYNNGVPKSSWAQHLGVDLKADTKTKVVSPVDGYVIENNTMDGTTTQAQAYIVIKETTTGYEHVLGHIYSINDVCRNIAAFPKNCSEKSRVYKGKSDVGRPMPKNEFAVHVHWGLNSRSISAAKGNHTGTKWGNASGKKWGWGRAPVEATKSMGCSLGWIDPTGVTKC